MLLQDTPEKFRELFLLAFTRELIINAGGGEVLELESEVKKVEKERREEVKKVVKEGLAPKPVPVARPLPRPVAGLPKRLVIPGPRFPARLAYIRPAPTALEIDLGKINPLMQDPVVQIIECHGPEKPVIVRVPTERKTNIVLSKDDIDAIIKEFSAKGKIPVPESGVFRVAAGRFILSAIMSDVVGTKFIIKKLRYSTTPTAPTALQRPRVFGVPPTR